MKATFFLVFGVLFWVSGAAKRTQTLICISESTPPTVTKAGTFEYYHPLPHRPPIRA